ncbi:hypothetical protein [Rugamonas apoptosis]|uniref:Uncharacterized protein n=1 Tax=Rugamonas apoptosis TaxID=2758570 RepID=A0A7W2FCE4_9BURK|nr:hypothetical protein [Rugamonas apoptosis]MBA5689158.1 hypothetical protein [Rugamonas apoptosis]
MSVQSIQAIQACMAFLGLRLDQPVHKSVGCFFAKQGGSAGPMRVVFQNDVHGHQGPYLVFDHTIRGFGIPFQEFKPAYQTFQFKEGNDAGTLMCAGNGYVFSMTFQR